MNPLDVPPPIIDRGAYVRTRESLHALAEHVLAAALFRTTGKIGLRATSGGFGTPRFGAGEQVRVDGTTLVHAVGEVETRHALTTLAVAAAEIAVEPGAPAVYEAATPLDLERPLDLDPPSARVVGWLYGFASAALAQLTADAESNPAGTAPPSLVQLWPEHFDIATDLGAARANFGASPGDAAHPEPYLYVGPRETKPADPFWNEPFGASLPYSALIAAPSALDTALAFFRRGRDLLKP